MVHSFILKKQPKSHNKWKRSSPKGQSYLAYVRAMFDEFYETVTKKSGDLYGIAYYFHKINTGTDADNISKPIWDCLSDFLFEDDKQIKLRLAGCFDLAEKDFEVLDVSGVPGNVVAELVQAIQDEEHIVYVECGRLTDSLYKFNLQK